MNSTTSIVIDDDDEDDYVMIVDGHLPSNANGMRGGHHSRVTSLVSNQSWQQKSPAPPRPRSKGNGRITVHNGFSPHIEKHSVSSAILPTPPYNDIDQCMPVQQQSMVPNPTMVNGLAPSSRRGRRPGTGRQSLHQPVSPRITNHPQIHHPVSPRKAHHQPLRHPGSPRMPHLQLPHPADKQHLPSLPYINPSVRNQLSSLKRGSPSGDKQMGMHSAGRGTIPLSQAADPDKPQCTCHLSRQNSSESRNQKQIIQNKPDQVIQVDSDSDNDNEDCLILEGSPDLSKNCSNSSPQVPGMKKNSESLLSSKPGFSSSGCSTAIQSTDTIKNTAEFSHCPVPIVVNSNGSGMKKKTIVGVEEVHPKHNTGSTATSESSIKASPLKALLSNLPADDKNHNLAAVTVLKNALNLKDVCRNVVSDQKRKKADLANNLPKLGKHGDDNMTKVVYVEDELSSQSNDRIGVLASKDPLVKTPSEVTVTIDDEVPSAFINDLRDASPCDSDSLQRLLESESRKAVNRAKKRTAKLVREGRKDGESVSQLPQEVKETTQLDSSALPPPLPLNQSSPVFNTSSINEGDVSTLKRRLSTSSSDNHEENQVERDNQERSSQILPDIVRKKQSKREKYPVFGRKKKRRKCESGDEGYARDSRVRSANESLEHVRCAKKRTNMKRNKSRRDTLAVIRNLSNKSQWAHVIKRADIKITRLRIRGDKRVIQIPETGDVYKRVDLLYLLEKSDSMPYKCISRGKHLKPGAIDEDFIASWSKTGKTEASLSKFEFPGMEDGSMSTTTFNTSDLSDDITDTNLEETIPEIENDRATDPVIALNHSLDEQHELNWVKNILTCESRRAIRRDEFKGVEIIGSNFDDSFTDESVFSLYSNEEIWLSYLEKFDGVNCQCGMVFKDRQLCHVHLKCHRASEPMHCGQCGLKSDTWNAFYFHLIDHTK